jgi:hypothetical protein
MSSPTPSGRTLTSRPALAFLAAVLVGTVVALVVLAATGGSSPKRSAAASPTATAPSAQPSESEAPKTPGQLWMDSALGDFKPMKGVLVGFTKALAAWQDGTGTGKDALASVDYALPQIQATRAALQQRAAFAQAPKALDDYRQAVTLYVQAARVVRVGAALPAGPLTDQLKLEYGRLRNLADRVFDQAGVELAPYLPTPPVIDGVEFQKPVEVPDWASLSLAAGPPLDAAPTPHPRRTYQDKRPEQPFKDWLAAVTRADVPSAGTVAATITGGSADALRTLSDRLGAASEALYADADPKGERPASTRVQLALLVEAEGARTAQAATLLPGAARSQLQTVAKALTLVGDDLWDSRLGTRDSGFSRDLLSA